MHNKASQLSVLLIPCLQLHEMQEASKARHQKELEQVREATAREMKHYYLQCLHQLVNDNSGTDDLGSNYLSPTQGVQYQSSHAVCQFPSHIEDLDSKLQSGHTTDRIHVPSTAFGESNQRVSRKHDMNSHTQRLSEAQPEKTTVQSEKQQSNSGGSSSRAQLSGPKASAPAHNIRTGHNMSSTRRTSIAGKSKNLEGSVRHQRVKGAGHHSSHGAVGGRGERTGIVSVKIKKDPLGGSCTGKRTAVSAHAAHSKNSGSEKVSKSSRRSSNTDKKH